MSMLSPSKIKKQNFERLSSKMSIVFSDESSFEISQNMWRIITRPMEKAKAVWFETRHSWISVTWWYTIEWDFIYKTSISKKTIDFIRFLYLLRYRIKKKRIILIIDNASIHKSKKVKKYCKEHNIILVYLPPYSPEYNKIEFLRKWLKNMFQRLQWKYDDIKKAIKMASNTIKDEFRWVNILEMINLANP